MPRMGQLEALVMDRLWARGGATSVREVLEELQQERSIAYTTVMTVMDNLHRKGLLRREVDGRAYRYSPTQSRDQHTAEMMREALAHSQDRTSALLHFVEDMTPEQIEGLHLALDERRTRDEGRR